MKEALEDESTESWETDDKTYKWIFSYVGSILFSVKDLYNHANYIVRQSFVKDNKWIRYGELDKQLRADKDYPDYAEMPTAQAAQQTLRLLDKNWKSFFASIKDWSKNKDKIFGKPKTSEICK